MAVSKKKSQPKSKPDWSACGRACAFLFLVVCMLSAGSSHAVVTMAINEFYDIETNTISAVINSSMDFRCTETLNGVGVGRQGLTPVNNARRWVNTSVILTIPVINNSIGYEWTQTQQTWRQNIQIWFVTNQGNYSRISSNGATNNACVFNELGTGTPVSTINKTPFVSGDYATITTASFQVNDTVAVRLDFTDLGWFYENNTYQFFVPSSVVGMDAQLDIYNSYVSVINGTRASFATGQTYPNTQMSYLTSGLNCNALSSANTTADFTVLNVIGVTPLCWYPVVPAGKAGAFMVNETRNDLGDPANVRKDFRVNLALYDLSTFNIITTVSHSPTSPSPSQNVTVTFSSTLQSNSTVFLRYRNVSAGNGEANFSAWFSFFQPDNTFLHTVVVNGQYILDSKFYQYYVIAGTANNTNGGTYYNFTVGSLGNVVGVGSGNNTVGTAIVNLSNSGWCSGSSCVWLFIGLPILAIFTIFGWWKLGATAGKAIGITFLVVESSVGLLPIFFLIPIIVLVAYLIAKQFGLLGGND